MDRDKVTCSGDAAHDLGIPNRGSTSSLLARRRTCKEWFPNPNFQRPTRGHVGGLRITRLRKCMPSASAGCRPGRYLLMTKRMRKRLVACAGCFAEGDVCTYQFHPLDGRTIRTSGIIDCIWVKRSTQAWQACFSCHDPRAVAAASAL